MAYKKLKYWFDEDLARMLSEKIQKEYEVFDTRDFIKQIADGTRGLELKDRVEFIAEQLLSKLPADFTQAIDILQRILGPENQKETGMFTDGYWIMPIAKYVENYGMDYFSRSMQAIEEITKRHTGEYCIRPFIKKYPNETLKIMESWSHDENVHLRRLSSEGLRLRLPWAKKLEQFVENPTPIIEIVDNLKDDNSRFVQKSVANNLNDILKDNYEVGIKTIKKWSIGATQNRKWIIKHALRYLIKKDHPEAIKIIERLK